MHKNVVVAGKSGAGKQPRIDVLTEEYGFQQLSTGNIFRHYLGLTKSLTDMPDAADFWNEKNQWFDEVALNTALDLLSLPAGISVDEVALSAKVKYFVLNGLFVPDRITNELFAAAFAAKGYAGCVLDGYPRTVDQAKYLLELLTRHGSSLEVVLVVDSEDQAIIDRLMGRRICPDADCGKVYHMEFKPPKDGNHCDVCGKEVILRADDTEEKIKSRLREFTDKAQPAIDWLSQQGIVVVVVPGNLPEFTPENVRRSVLDSLSAKSISL